MGDGGRPFRGDRYSIVPYPCLFLLELGVPDPLTGATMPVESPFTAASPAATRAQREFARECVDFFAEVVQLFGVPKSVGQIYGLLFASSLPLSFSDIVERLEISKGSASQGLQLLRSLGAINEAKSEGLSAKSEVPVDSLPRQAGGGQSAVGGAARRVAYEPELSLRRLMSGILQERGAPFAATGADRLARLRELAEQGGEQRSFYLDRAKQLNTWRRRLKTVLPVFSALLGPKGQK